MTIFDVKIFTHQELFWRDLSSRNRTIIDLNQSHILNVIEPKINMLRLNFDSRPLCSDHRSPSNLICPKGIKAHVKKTSAVPLHCSAHMRERRNFSRSLRANGWAAAFHLIWGEARIAYFSGHLARRRCSGRNSIRECSSGEALALCSLCFCEAAQ